MTDLCIEPGTGWHGDNFRVIDLAVPGGKLLRSFTTYDGARAYVALAKCLAALALSDEEAR